MSPELLVVNLIVAVAAFVQTTTGIGFALVAVPMLVLVDLSYAPGPSLFVMLFLAVAMVLGSWRDVERQSFAALFPGLLIGTVIGSQIIGLLSASAFGVVFGSIVLAALALGQFGFSPTPSPVVNASGGCVSGLMGTISGIHGPPLAVLYQRVEPAKARATIAFVFVFASAMSLVLLYWAGRFGRQDALAGLALLPGLTVGFLVASTGRRFISDRVARGAMLGIAAVSAVVLIVRSVL